MRRRARRAKPAAPPVGSHRFQEEPLGGPTGSRTHPPGIPQFAERPPPYGIPQVPARTPRGSHRFQNAPPWDPTVSKTNPGGIHRFQNEPHEDPQVPDRTLGGSRRFQNALTGDPTGSRHGRIAWHIVGSKIVVSGTPQLIAGIYVLSMTKR